MSRIRVVLFAVVLAVVAFLAGRLARGLFAGGDQIWLVSAGGDISVNSVPVSEPTKLRSGDVVEVAAGQRYAFLSDDR